MELFQSYKIYLRESNGYLIFLQENTYMNFYEWSVKAQLHMNLNIIVLTDYN